MASNGFPTIQLGFYPTPVHRLPRFGDRWSAETGQRVDWWIKRDDMTGLATGGNKVRKLEYLLADALAHHATTIVAGGGLQSNFARQTAAACARLGLDCVLGLCPGYLDDVEFTLGGNVLLDDLLGAEVRVYPGLSSTEAIQAAADELAGEGRDAYVIPMGGSNAIGSLGYVDAVHELAAQFPDEPPDLIAVAAGSCGTAAGIIAGIAALGWPTRVLAPCVNKPADATHAEIVRQLEGLAALGCPVDGVEWDAPDQCLGGGYGVPTDGMLSALRMLARTEGILLDPVYTGKAFDGLLTELRDGTIEAGRIVFWHTGGAPGLFAYRGTLSEPA